MSLAYKGGVSLLPMLAATVTFSGAAHVALPVVLTSKSEEAAPAPLETGVQGAIMFDLSDIIAAPTAAGEDSREVAEAEEAATVTESPELVDPAKAADEPILNQSPYEVEDDTLKFGVASPDPVENTERDATATAAEYEEEKVHEPSSTGATAAEASNASVSGVDADQTAESAQASSEGLSAADVEQITEWQKEIVLKVAHAKSYPDAARAAGIEGEVRIRFELDRYGNVLARSVEQTSGHDVLDQAALGVIDGIGKMPTPPNALVGDSFTLVIPINYSINRG